MNKEDREDRLVVTPLIDWFKKQKPNWGIHKPAYTTNAVSYTHLQDQNPTDAARWAALVNRLVPRAFPDVYLIEGSAYFDLHRYDDAEKAARAGIDADPKFIYPGLRKLMGEVLYQKRSYAAALELFEWYLTVSYTHLESA